MAYSPDQEKAPYRQPISSNHNTLLKHDTPTVQLGVALLQLPQEYFKAIVKPGIATYIREKDQASWRLAWIQLLLWAILDAALGVLVNLISPPATASFFSRFYTIATSYGLVVVVPVLFFLLMGIVYLLARSFGGQGTFLEQCYCSLSVQVPLGILSKLLALIPGVGRILNSALSLYGIVLMVIVIAAVHRLSKGKSIGTILLPLLAIGLVVGIVFLLTR